MYLHWPATDRKTYWTVNLVLLIAFSSGALKHHDLIIWQDEEIRYQWKTIGKAQKDNCLLIHSHKTWLIKSTITYYSWKICIFGVCHLGSLFGRLFIQCPSHTYVLTNCYKRNFISLDILVKKNQAVLFCCVI